jgi:hypothetical protein
VHQTLQDKYSETAAQIAGLEADLIAKDGLLYRLDDEWAIARATADTAVIELDEERHDHAATRKEYEALAAEQERWAGTVEGLKDELEVRAAQSVVEREEWDAERG